MGMDNLGRGHVPAHCKVYRLCSVDVAYSRTTKFIRPQRALHTGAALQSLAIDICHAGQTDRSEDTRPLHYRLPLLTRRHKTSYPFDQHRT